jgi:cysteine desulfurase
MIATIEGNRTTRRKPDQRAPVYLDNHATTPVDPRVARIVFDTMTEKFGNAHSVDHVYGQTAATLVQQAAAEVADLLRASPDHVRFTSCATEAIRIALSIAAANVKRLRVGVSHVEHKAVLDPLRALEQEGRATLRWIEVDGAGRVSLDDLARVVTDGVDLVCLMAATMRSARSIRSPRRLRSPQLAAQRSWWTRRQPSVES